MSSNAIDLIKNATVIGSKAISQGNKLVKYTDKETEKQKKVKEKGQGLATALSKKQTVT